MAIYTTIDEAKKMSHYEKHSEKSVTEQAGYIPPKVQIQNMINAGQRLSDYRAGLYDFNTEAEIDEEAYDPTRAGNYDLADATQAQIETEQKIKAHKAAVRASQTAQEALQAASKVEPVLPVIPAPNGA